MGDTFSVPFILSWRNLTVAKRKPAKRRRQGRRTVKKKKNTRSDEQKNKLCTCSTLFLYISLPLFYTTTTWNFQKLLSYSFFGENALCVLDHFFHCLSLSFCHLCYKIFMLFFRQKMSPLFFISRSRSLSPFFSLSLAGLLPTFSFSLPFSCSIFQI